MPLNDWDDLWRNFSFLAAHDYSDALKRTTEDFILKNTNYIDECAFRLSLEREKRSFANKTKKVNGSKVYSKIANYI